jgi:predicted HicB family RNase H-like nuclease
MKSESKKRTTKSRGLRLDSELWDDLESLAKADRRKLNEFISIVLEDFVKSIKRKK